MGYARRSSGAGTAVKAVVSAPAPSSSSSKGKKPSIWQMEIGGKEKRMRMTRIEVLLFTSELADLIEAGMTLGQALRALANQGEENSGQRFVCQDLCDRIVRGETFSDAIAHHPKTFEPLYSNMVRAAEASGAMVEVLRRLGDHYERYDNMRSKIKSAMSYPVIVMVFGVLAVVAALVWIIPKFERVFAQMGGTLPLPTRMLIGMSNALIHYGWLMLAGVVLAVVWFKRWAKSPSGRRTVDRWKLRAPLIKGIVACGAYSTLAYTLKTLLSNGVNVLQALKIAEETSGNAVIGDALAEARKRVTDGTSISGPLAASGVFPRMMTDMLAVGEQAGDMVSSLEHIGKRYQKDMDANITSFTNALEPILIIMIAGIVGFIAVSVLMAVFKLSSTMGPYNWAIRPRGTVFPYFCSLLPGDPKAVKVRFLMIEGWQTFHDFIRTRIDRNFGYYTTPMEMPHFELVVTHGGETKVSRHDPGFMPRPLVSAEIPLVSKILWESYGVFLRVESDRKLPLSFASTKAMFARQESADGVWTDEPLAIPEPPPLVEKVSFPKSLLTRAKDLPFESARSIELDFRLLPNLMTRETRPRCAYQLLAIATGTRERVLADRVSVQADFGLKAMWEAMPQRALLHLVETGRIPGEIKVLSGRVFRLLRPLCLDLPFRLSLHDSLPDLETAFQDLTRNIT